MNGIRVFFHGGLIAYRALFNWLRPAVFIPTLIIGPTVQVLFFTYLGRHSGLADDTFFIVGNAIHMSTACCLFGMVMCLANERQFDTMAAVLATPVNRFAVFFGRTLAPMATGTLVSCVGFGVAYVLLDFRMPLTALPIVALAAISCTMFGVAFGAIAMRLNDIFFGSNVTYNLMLLLCGVNVPLAVLPDWLAAIGRVLPLTHSIEAIRQLAAGAQLSQVTGLIGREALIAAGYALLGFVLLRLFEAESRRRATLHTT